MTAPVSGGKPLLALLIRLLWAAAPVLPAFGAQAGVVLTTLHSFAVFTNGANGGMPGPSAGLVQGNDGNFYGTAQYGGTNGGHGTVFKISTAGVLTSLYSFTGGNDGASPNGLVQGSDGNFYGTTQYGGTNGLGTVFRISTAGVLTCLYSFTGGNDGGEPQAALVQGSNGNFYGTTEGGRAGNLGTVFKISTGGTLTGLYSFTGGNDGAFPNGLVQGSDGSFYGTTGSGGANKEGTVFRISTNGALTSLYPFTGGNDGAGPQAGLVQGSDGNFYGTTEVGGAYTNQYGGFGTVFKISTNGTLTSLHSFTGGNDGAYPYAGLVQGSDGNFYGTTSGGGADGDGTVFKMSANGTLTSLYSFTRGNDGASPLAGLVQDSGGNFYGTTQLGGANGGHGTVFKMGANGALISLYSFNSGNDGEDPYAGLVQGSDGNFYGTTQLGGTNGLGTVFQISPEGALTTLHAFAGGNDGEYPLAGLVQGSDGYLYGTTTGFFASSDQGTVFKISTNGVLTSLYAFTGGNDGASPNGLAQASDGYLYGTTYTGGTNDYGTVFKISTAGVLTGLYSFTDGDDGAYPDAGLVQGTDGHLYGTTTQKGPSSLYPPGKGPPPTGGGGYGNVFKITTNGTVTSLYSFTGGNDGEYPEAGLVQGSDGNFYGTTQFGGAYGLGAVFQISPKGALATLHAFAGGNDGQYPSAGLVQGSDGNFYGTTYSGGAYTNQYGEGNGTVFEISSNGALTTLYSFTGGNDGAGPQAGLVQGSDGNFYGTTSGGGEGGGGTVFRLTVAPAAPVFQAVVLANGTLSLTWSTEVGGMYQPQFNSDLTSTNWTNLGSVLTAAGTTLSTTDSVTNGLRRFYRLVLLP